MKFEERLAFSATVHALGGYLFVPYDLRGVHDIGDQRFHIIDHAGKAEGRAVCGRLAASKGSLSAVEDFPQGAELCPWCCEAILGKQEVST